MHSTSLSPSVTANTQSVAKTPVRPAMPGSRWVAHGQRVDPVAAAHQPGSVRMGRRWSFLFLRRSPRHGAAISRRYGSTSSADRHHGARKCRPLVRRPRPHRVHCHPQPGPTPAPSPAPSLSPTAKPTTASPRRILIACKETSDGLALSESSIRN
jgi:hypothetical protein